MCSPSQGGFALFGLPALGDYSLVSRRSPCLTFPLIPLGVRLQGRAQDQAETGSTTRHSCSPTFTQGAKCKDTCKNQEKSLFLQQPLAESQKQSHRHLSLQQEGMREGPAQPLQGEQTSLRANPSVSNQSWHQPGPLV